MVKKIKEMKEKPLCETGSVSIRGGTIITIANNDNACLEYTYSRQILM